MSKLAVGFWQQPAKLNDELLQAVIKKFGACTTVGELTDSNSILKFLAENCEKVIVILARSTSNFPQKLELPSIRFPRPMLVVTKEPANKTLGSNYGFLLKYVSPNVASQNLVDIIESQWLTCNEIQIANCARRSYEARDMNDSVLRNYLNNLRVQMNFNAVAFYSLDGRSTHLRCNEIVGETDSLPSIIAFQEAKQLLTFNASIQTVTFSNPVFQQVAPQKKTKTESAWLACSLTTQERNPCLLLIEVEREANIFGLERLCTVAAREVVQIRSNVRGSAKFNTILAAFNAQSHLPDRETVFRELCEVLQRHFLTQGVTIYLSQGSNENGIRFAKYALHFHRWMVNDFTSNSGYAHYCWSKTKSILINSTDDERNMGHGFEFDANNISVDEGRAASIEHVNEPVTVELEKSTLLAPIPGNVFPNGVLKVANFDKDCFFSVEDLGDLQSFAIAFSSLLYGIETGDRLLLAESSIGGSSSYLNDNAELFLFRNLTLETFHQLSNSLDNANSKLAIALRYAKETNEKSVELLKYLVATNEFLFEAKQYLKRAQDSGRLQDEKRDCQLIKEVLHPVVSRGNRRIRDNWKIHTSFQKREFVVNVDPFLLQEALINVVSNAIWAIRNRHKRNGDCKLEVAVRPGDHEKFVNIVIQDNGIGIDSRHVSKIFDPFFTTKGKRGSGLGLSLSRRFIEQIGGNVMVLKTKVNSGTTILVELPIVGEKQ